MSFVCEKDQCAGCMACVDICPKSAITVTDSLSAFNAVIDENKCIHCNACHNVCQENHPAELREPKMWQQGWANEETIRAHSSSGGLATAISLAFVKSGGVVCSCTFKDGDFVFAAAEKEEDIQNFSGSKYVKSNPVGICNTVRRYLKKGQKVLFIGLPCQVSSMRNFVGKLYESNLYTIDLICHGTPSPQVLNIFLEQYGYSLDQLDSITFRLKTHFMMCGNEKSIITYGVSDKYSIAFLNSLIYTENCYNCHYARKERVSDLTLGDSWGSELPMEEQKKGISLLLSQTDKGNELLKMADAHLEDVDLDNAIKNNHQLEYPSIEPNGREEFFKHINTTKFNKLILKQLPKQCLRQDVKKALINLHLINPGGWKKN